MAYDKSFLGIDIGPRPQRRLSFAGGIRCTGGDGTGPSVERVADILLKQVLAASGMSSADLNGVVATGYGRTAVRFADKKVTEITCHARGVNHLMPEARTVIDIGGQDSKAMRIDGQGRVIDFIMNDKCAAGTGRFLEVMARALELPIDDLGSRSIASLNPCLISSLCTVFAESEVVFLRGEGRSPEDIAAGIHVAIAGRVATMISRWASRRWRCSPGEWR